MANSTITKPSIIYTKDIVFTAYQNYYVISDTSIKHILRSNSREYMVVGDGEYFRLFRISGGSGSSPTMLTGGEPVTINCLVSN